MPLIETMTISPLDLTLWKDNPRFIQAPAKPDQELIRLQLLGNSEVEQLAKSIIIYGGLMPGERVVAIKSDDSYIILEGNRRVCACQLLLKPELIPDAFRTAFPHATDELARDISHVEVDVVNSVDDTLSFLAARHITGVKRWPPISKQRFFVSLFERTYSLDEVVNLTTMPMSEIRADLQNYYLLDYAIQLPLWTTLERASIDWPAIKPDIFQRIFNTSGAREALKLEYDGRLQPISGLPKDIFDKAIGLVARAAYITKKINTRTKSIWNVPGLTELLTPKPPAPKPDPSPNPPDETPGPNQEPETKPGEPKHPPDQPGMGRSPVNPLPRIFDFFEDLRCEIDPTDRAGRGILPLVREIRIIPYRKVPIATAMLLRTLVDQAFRYHLKKIGHWDQVITKNPDPMFKVVLDYVRINLKAVFDSSTDRRLFESAFKDNGIKHHFDLIVHHPDVATVTDSMLCDWAKGGLMGLVESMLTKKYTQ